MKDYSFKNNKIKEVIEETAAEVRLKEDKDLKNFMEGVFRKITDQFDVCKNFQARAKIYGDVFEVIFEFIMKTFYPEINLISKKEIPQACMEAGGEADFVVVDKENNIIAVIETKGSAEHIVCNGKVTKLPRPGMMRTDTVKKAISNAFQVKKGIGDDVYFFVVTSHVPERGNAKCMIDLALNSGLFDMVVCITNFDELEKMVSKIKQRIKD